MTKVSFSPQRFLSHALPCAVLVRSFECIVSYLTSLAGGDGEAAAWARTLMPDVRELKSWLILAIVGDMLLCLRKLNLATQRKQLRILQVDALVADCKRELSSYMDQGSGLLAKALRKLFERHEKKPPEVNLVTDFCSKIYMKTHGQRILECTYKVGERTEFSLHAGASTLSEVVQIAQEIEKDILDDLDRRFTHVGIAKYFYVFHAGYQDVPAQPLKAAMKAFAAHFGFHHGDLLAEYKHALRLKDERLRVHPHENTLPAYLRCRVA